MTKFKELRRIKAAITHGNIAELQWALRYCEMRVAVATMKEHAKFWTKRGAEVRAALDESAGHGESS